MAAGAAGAWTASRCSDIGASWSNFGRADHTCAAAGTDRCASVRGVRRGALTTSWAALLAVLLGLVLAAPASAALTFKACPGMANLGCAELSVPLDPANPAGPQIK